MSISSDDFFEILKRSSRNKYSDPHIPNRVSSQNCFYGHWLCSQNDGRPSKLGSSIRVLKKKKIVFKEIHLLLIYLLHHKDKGQKNGFILMRTWDARSTRLGTGMAGTEAGTEYGSPGTGWRVQDGYPAGSSHSLLSQLSCLHRSLIQGFMAAQCQSWPWIQVDKTGVNMLILYFIANNYYMGKNI